MSPYIIYLFVIIGNIKVTLPVLLILTFIGMLAFLIMLGNCYFNYDPEDGKLILFIKRWLKYLFIVFCIIFLSDILLPSSTQLSAIYVIPKIVNNENTAALPDNLVKAANKYLLSIIEEKGEE